MLATRSDIFPPTSVVNDGNNFGESSSDTSGPTDDEGGIDDDDVFCTLVSSVGSVSKRGDSEERKSQSQPLPERRSSIGPGPIPSRNRHIDLLERIIKTHPIWYLPGMTRSATSHLLREMEPGNFIVRESSKTGQMALTIRLCKGEERDVDHYLIEPTNLGVRLSGSMNHFPHIPSLLVYYSSNGDEIRKKLSLASVLMKCESRMELQCYALLGQDFWTSEHVRKKSSRLTPSLQKKHDYINNDIAPIPQILSQTSSPARLPSPSISVIGRKRSSTPSDCSSGNGSLLASHRFQKGAQQLSAIKYSIDPYRRESSAECTCEKKRGSPMRKHSVASTQTSSQPVQKPIPVSAAPSKVRSKSVSARPESGESRFFQFFKRKEPKKSLQSDCLMDTSLQDPRIPHYENQVQYFSQGTSNSASSLVTERSHSFDTTPIMSRKPLETFKPSVKSKKEDSSNIDAPWAPVYSSDPSVEYLRIAPMGTTPVDHSANYINATNNLLMRERSTSVRVGPPPTKPKPSAKLRREKSDIGSELSALLARKANFLHISSSSTQALTNAPNSPAVERRRHAESQERGRGSPIAPLQSREDVRTEPKDASDVKQKTDAGTSTIGSNGVSNILRLKKPQPRPENRLSAPNLLDKPVAVVKAEEALGTISEGLVTPVPRRRLGKRPVLTKRYSQSLEDLLLEATEPEEEMPLETVPEDGHFNRFYGSSRITSQRKIPNSSFIQQSQSFRTGKTTSAWSDINEELKKRQNSSRIAKVSPLTPLNKLKSFTPIKPAEPPLVPAHALQHLNREIHEDNDDAVSVAGTVFNEPWDSSAWENLLDLANYGDSAPTKSANSVSGSFLLKRKEIQEAEVLITEEEEPDDRYGCVSTAAVDYRNRLKENGQWKTPEWKVNNVTPKHSVKEALRHSPSESSSAGTWSSQRSLLAQNNKTTDEKGERWNITPVMSPARLRSAKARNGRVLPDPGKKIQDYVESIAKANETVFGGNIQQFIDCTANGTEDDPLVVTRNIRQFMNGMKNYLSKHGEMDLHGIIEQERARLRANELLNIDAILEEGMHKIVLGPLKPRIYHLMIKESTVNGSLKTFSDNMAAVKEMEPSALGLRDLAQVPSNEQLEEVRNCLRRMQEQYSPMKKLEYLLKAVRLAYKMGSPDKNQRLPPADDLVRWLVFVLSRSNMVGCEVEAQYMWNLLPQQLLTGEASYYITALFSAIQFIKHPNSIPKLASSYRLEEDSALSLVPLERNRAQGSDGLLRVAVPDELSGQIRYHTFPAVSQMTTAKLCKMIAHKLSITNPEDYGFYLLVDGYETCLLASECPDLVRDQLRAGGKAHMFAYKRQDAKIAWPKVAMSPML